MSTPNEWVDVCIGRLPREQVANIAREVRYLWHNLENLYPQGDKKRRAQLKVTLDKFGQYHIYLNQQALFFILLLHKDIPGPDMPAGRKAIPECPPKVPDFLRWDKPKSGATGDSKPAPTE